MPVHLYETMFVLDAGKMSSDGDMLRGALHAALEKHGGQILVSRPWNENQKLSYPINKQKKGYFHIVYYNMESTHQAALESDMRLGMTDFLLRHLTSHVDPRYAEVMLDIARNDQNPTFALRGMHEEPSPTDLTPASINDPGAPGAAGGPDGSPVPNLNAGAPVGGPGPRGPRARRQEASEKPE